MKNWLQNGMAKPIKEKAAKERVNCQKLFPSGTKNKLGTKTKREKRGISTKRTKLSKMEFAIFWFKKKKIFFV